MIKCNSSSNSFIYNYISYISYSTPSKAALTKQGLRSEKLREHYFEITLDVESRLSRANVRLGFENLKPWDLWREPTPPQKLKSAN